MEYQFTKETEMGDQREEELSVLFGAGHSTWDSLSVEKGALL